MIEIPRLPDFEGVSDTLAAAVRDPAGPAWLLWRADATFHAGWDVIVRCPHGHFATLSPSKHKVAADGAVTPSIYFLGMCPGAEDWHVFGRLLGWDAAAAAMYGSGLA